MTDVYLNENYIGDIENPKEFVRKVRSERRKSSIYLEQPAKGHKKKKVIKKV